MDWLSNDTFSVLNASGGPTLIIDDDVEVGLNASLVNNLSLSIVESDCGGEIGQAGYAVPGRIENISSAINALVPPNVTINYTTVIFRKYKAGEAKYLWLVDTHNHSEYMDLYSMKSYINYGSSLPNETTAAWMEDYLTNHSIYNGTLDVSVGFKGGQDYVVYDVFEKTKLTSTFTNNWNNFTVNVSRLKGKLIALYPEEPSSLAVTAPSTVNASAGENFTATVQVNSNSGSISAVFPIYVNLIDPYGISNPYTKYTATNSSGGYGTTFLIGANAPKGTWIMQVDELSTGLQSNSSFVVS